MRLESKRGGFWPRSLKKQRTLFQRDAARRTRQRTMLRALAGLRRQFTTI
jgi:hypothetical protein